MGLNYLLLVRRGAQDNLKESANQASPLRWIFTDWHKVKKLMVAPEKNCGGRATASIVPRVSDAKEC